MFLTLVCRTASWCISSSELSLHFPPHHSTASPTYRRHIDCQEGKSSGHEATHRYIPHGRHGGMVVGRSCLLYALRPDILHKGCLRPCRYRADRRVMKLASLTPPTRVSATSSRLQWAECRRPPLEIRVSIGCPTVSQLRPGSSTSSPHVGQEMRSGAEACSRYLAAPLQESQGSQLRESSPLEFAGGHQLRTPRESNGTVGVEIRCQPCSPTEADRLERRGCIADKSDCFDHGAPSRRKALAVILGPSTPEGLFWETDAAASGCGLHAVHHSVASASSKTNSHAERSSLPRAMDRTLRRRARFRSLAETRRRSELWQHHSLQYLQQAPFATWTGGQQNH
mmetsp:Transcript_106853/g.300415  ORF Transcript_106853/g.300415 Transcript_106853/m.300415 type:complete len:340 (+) Transcript_106853:44-1063(+)